MTDGSFFLMITMSGKKSISIDLCHAPMHFTILIFIPRHISNYYFFYLQLHSDYGRPNQICDGGVALTIDGGWLIKKTNFGIGIVLNRQVGDIALYIRPWFFPLSPGKKKQSFIFNSRNNRKYFRIVKHHYKKKGYSDYVTLTYATKYSHAFYYLSRCSNTN